MRRNNYVPAVRFMATKQSRSSLYTPPTSFLPSFSQTTEPPEFPENHSFIVYMQKWSKACSNWRPNVALVNGINSKYTVRLVESKVFIEPNKKMSTVNWNTVGYAAMNDATSNECYNERCLSKKSECYNEQMLQRSRRNTIGRRSTRVRMTSDLPALIRASVIIFVIVC
jgi:hypothetical protein